MKFKYSAIKLDDSNTPVEVVGYWESKEEAYFWANKNWDHFVIVPYWRINA